MCCNSWGHKELDTTKWLNWTELGTIKDRNGKQLTKVEKIKKRCQEYKDELHKKGVNDSNNQDGVITHLKPDKSWIVKSSQALVWTKLVKLIEFQLSYFKS